MKESISIIFAAIIGTFLIVILPLYSILDRQDSMSYNVVLTATTNFVDNVRNNGFIDRDSYNDYIAALASTSNTYKVNLEVYKRVLINETDENGKVIEDSYVEEKELYNTQDILEVLDEENAKDINRQDSNIKNNVYLLNENDEIYVRIRNTNITTGSILYSMLADNTNTEVINISYGGIVNKVNWELYDKITAQAAMAPEVLISVPVNAYGSTNIQKVDKNNNEGLENIDCSLENLEELSGSTTIEDLCGDILEEGQDYVYLYDLTKRENKTITVAVELRRFAKIDIGGEYTDISRLRDVWSKKVEQHIIENYIVYDGFWAGIDITLRENGDYYVFEITFTNVTMSQIDYISNLAKVVILPGLGVDEYGTASLSAESVEIELTDTDAINTVAISMPIIWNKFLKTESLVQSAILNNVVYAKEDIAFLISYTGIKNKEGESDADRDQRILQAIKQHLSIHESSSWQSEVEYFTEGELKEQYDINVATASAGHVMVKFRYNSANTSNENYISLPNGWIETNLENTYDPETGEESQVLAVGAQSVRYEVQLDNSAPLEPTIELAGTLGNNDWYTSDVTLIVISSNNDTIIKNGKVQVGGSGVYRNTLTIEGVTTQPEKETNSVALSKNGISYATGKAYDYVGNSVATQRKEIKIDKTNPTIPTITLGGTLGNNGWYTSDVTINITPGTDDISGVDKTTYTIEGANALDETEGTRYVLTKEGKSTVVATTYDKAGNKTEARIDVYIDKSVPPNATISVIKGEKNFVDNEWYSTDVTLRITVDAAESVSGLGISSYRITGSSEVPTTRFEGNTKEVTIDTNGTHNLTVYTYTQAGNFRETKYTVKIDKNAPNAPTVSIKGTEGENGWHTSNVEVAVTSNGDVGTSSEQMITYTITKDGVTSNETQITNNGKIFFNEQGEYILNVYSIDKALNKVEVEKTIKIDKTNPIPAEFVITGTKGIDDWYISNVTLAHQGAADNISGIQSVILSRNSITENTTGTKVTLTTKDIAGHIVTKEVTIKLDKSVPSAPVINLSVQPTGNGPFGTMVYNQNVGVTITPGKDYFITGVDNLDKTTLEVTTQNGSQVLLAETEATSFEITSEGIITVTARTYDKAGNVTIASKVIWINKTKPQTPKITSINGIELGEAAIKEVTDTSNVLSLGIANLTEGNDVKIILINQATYERIAITKTATENGLIDIGLNKKGTYSITVSQTNMFGTVSDESTGLYLYKYE